MLDVKSQDTTVTRIARRTRGQSHGPITRLMAPSDFGRLLKPFVFLDLIDNQGKPFSGFGLHPHSGIATLTYVAEGSVRYQDTNGAPENAGTTSRPLSTLCSGPRSEGAPFWSRTSCSRASWWPSGRRTPRSNSRPNPMQSSY